MDIARYARQDPGPAPPPAHAWGMPPGSAFLLRRCVSSASGRRGVSIRGDFAGSERVFSALAARVGVVGAADALRKRFAGVFASELFAKQCFYE